jgi:uncharacterized cysteine cluster protein YcgN (CxxCxxCC family)
MGEAKRRRLAGHVPCPKRVAGKSMDVVDRHQAFEKAHEAGDKEATIDVPCNGCRACCYYNGVNVNPDEEPPERLKHLQLHWSEQHRCWEIPKREDGACIYLGPNGCTVYEYRPTACRYYDCRLAAIYGWRPQFEGEQKAPAWEFTDSGTDLSMLKIRHMFGHAWLKEHTDEPLLERGHDDWKHARRKNPSRPALSRPSSHRRGNTLISRPVPVSLNLLVTARERGVSAVSVMHVAPRSSSAITGFS